MRIALIGAGNMARHHLQTILPREEDEVVAIVEPNPEAYALTAKMFEGRKLPEPFDNFTVMLNKYAGRLDAALISTPHADHYVQAKACLEAGMDVLLEKPMVMTSEEAQRLIETVDMTRRLMVVAFQGSLSPQIRHAAMLIRHGGLGPIQSISALTWQNWDQTTRNTWRQIPELAGGGFLFDTGAHMLNTISDLAGEDFAEVGAWFDMRGRPVEIRAVVMARLISGALVTMHASGDTIQSIGSVIHVFCENGIIRTGHWGERLDVKRADDEAMKPVQLQTMPGAWEQFVMVRRGEMPNPCPPQVGLRMAKLYEAIRLSASRNGAIVRLI